MLDGHVMIYHLTYIINLFYIPCLSQLYLVDRYSLWNDASNLEIRLLPKDEIGGFWRHRDRDAGGRAQTIRTFGD